jgi:hypothetical protein
MPRTAITPQRPTSSGTAVTFEAANVLGNSVPQDGHRVLVVVNGSGGSINVTLPTPGTIDTDLAIPDRVVAVPAGATRYIALGTPSSAPVYRQSDGSVNIDYSAVTSVTVAVLHVE